MTRIMAINESGLIAPLFRLHCEKLRINADQEDFTSVEVNQIKESAGKKVKVHEKVLDGYKVSECAELLGVTSNNFNVNYSHRVTKIRRGFYSRESVDKLVTSIDSSKNKEDKNVFKNHIKHIQRIQRLSVSEDIAGNAVVSIYLENVSQKDALQVLVDAFN